MGFRDKFKVKQDLKKQIEKEDAQSGSKNPYLIPYYQLDDGAKIKLLFVPFEDGDLWKRFSLHGPNTKLRGLDAVGCPRENHGGQDCPVCQKGFDIYATRPEDKKSKQYLALSTEARRWMPKGYTYMTALVLESPFEVPESPDANQVKLISVPQAVEDVIRNQIAEGEITQESISETPFFIKKEIGENKQAGYTTSYFSRQSLSDDEMAFLEDEDLIVEPIDSSDEKYKLNFVDATFEELEEWLETAEEKDAQQKRTKRKASDEDEEESSTPTRRTRKSTKADDVEDEQEQEQPEPEDTKEDEPEAKEEKSDKPMTLKEKIALAKQKKNR